MFRLPPRLKAHLCAALVALTASSAAAQGIVGTTALRERQTALFDSMSAAPQDLDLMFRYAGVSARLEDYEAAISTLERMLIFNPDLPRVRLELAALYFRIGSYAVAQRYFDSVLARPDLPPEVRGRADRFRAEIAERTRRHRFTGRLEFGAVYDSNASLSPTDRDVFLFGRPARRVLDGIGDESDVGASFLAEVTHRYDWGGQGNEYWQTDAAIFGRRYDDVSAGSSEAFFVRTGPQLALDGLAFGAKIRPFLDATHVRLDDERLYSEGAIGAEVRQIVGDDLSLFASARAAIREHRDRENEDGAIFDLRTGIAWTPVRDLTLTASLGGRFDRAKEDFESNTEGSLRLTASFAYDPGLAIAEDKWRLSAYASATYRQYDAPNPVVTLAETRRDTDLRLGIRNVFALRDGFYASLGATALHRDSSISNFELENFGVSASIGYRF